MISSNINVIHSIHNWLPRTATWLFNQVRFLPPNIESHIVCESTGNLDQFTLPNIHSLSETSIWQFYWGKILIKLGFQRHIGCLVEIARQQNASILHSHFGYNGWRNVNAARKAKLKHAVTFYGYDVNYYPLAKESWLKRYRELFDNVDRVLCEGHFMAGAIAQLGCPAEKITVHHLGVSVPDIPYKPRIWNKGENLRILIVGAFREKKGIPYALEALGRLQKKITLEITLIGDATAQADSQAEKARILAVMDRYNLTEKTRMLGFQPHAVMLQEAYRHHVFLSPSVTATDGDTEGGAPVSLIEMVASGMPIVSSRHCDIPEVVKDGETGLLADERNVDELAGQLERLVDNPDQWEQLTRQGRAHVEHEYDARTQGQALAAIYRELVAV